MASAKKAKKKTAAKKPAAKKPVAKKSAAKKPVAKKPAAKKPPAKKPAAKSPPAVSAAAAEQERANDRYRPLADALVIDLAACRGDEDKETAALQKALAGFEALRGGDDLPGGPEYFAEEGSVANPPALERVQGASEDDIYRWRMKLADLAGY